MTSLPVLRGVSASADSAAVARDLAQAVEGEVRFDLHNRMLYATDASLYQVEPLGVVIPSSISDAVLAVEFCARRGLAVLARGGGTSLAGQCTNRAVVIDFSPNCRRLLDVDAVGRTCRVEPGITVDDLNDQLSATGLFFAPDPATSRQANIGGCIGNNAAGARSVRYGRTSESVLAVDACLADGARVRFDEGAAARDARVGELTRRVVEVVRRHERLIEERFPKTIRRNAGYGLDMILRQLGSGGDDAIGRINLAPLLCGSEGTLAVTLGAQLKLFPKPRAKGLAVLSFDSLDDAIEAVVPILRTGPTAVELLDDTVIDLARENVECRRYVELMPAPASGRPLRAVLYVEYFGDAPAEIAESFEALRRTTPGIALQSHTDAAAMLNAWKLRKSGEPLLHGIPGHRKPITFVEDNAIPVENLATFVKEMRKIVEGHGTRAAFYAHASVGVLHVRPLLDIHEDADRERMKAIAVATADLAKSLGGVMSGEHGDGRVRTPLLERFYGPELMGAFREIKRIFDPRNLLNPGNVVDLSGQDPRPVDSIAQKLRVEPQADRPTMIPAGTETYFDYTDQHGFDGAVEMCNGAGVCRKKQGGTMCPSYMATLDERHSTRGRGNALRLAITGQLKGDAAVDGHGAAPDVWSDPGTMETLNLCLSCKACKTECPSNVDIARLKAEYTAQRYKARHAPLRARLFGAIRRLNELGGNRFEIANWMSSRGWFGGLIRAVMGIDARRSLPRFSVPLWKAWDGAWDAFYDMGVPRPREVGGVRSTDKLDGPKLALFGDCFTLYNESSIGLAAKLLFNRCGYNVVLADMGCCGRAKISMGLLPQAIEEIDGTLQKLRPLIEDDEIKAVLVAEPSCLSAIKDDWLSLKLRTPLDLRRRLAAKAYLPEDYFDRFWDQHPQRSTFRKPSRPIILHGHCHQKALWGAETSAKALRRAVGDQLRILDSGCCGMAGSFGFTKDRFDLSMRIGELTLFPAVRENRNAIIAAPGTSCRHQVHDGTGVRARHPVELLAEWIE